MADKLLSIFVSHGAPSLVLEPTPSRSFLSELGASLGRPRAVLCVSAHWEAPRPSVGAARHPRMIYDFYGFPPELSAVQYPAPGDPSLAQEVAKLLTEDGLDAVVDPSRGLDHGVWVPLSLMFPDATVPVVPLSVQPQLGAAHHFAIGRALRPLRQENVLILASGGATHNLRLLSTLDPGAPPPERTAAFEAWLCESVGNARVEDLLHYRERAPYVRWNHPTPEHFLPLLVALGAASDNAPGRILNRRFEYGALSMAAFAWA